MQPAIAPSPSDETRSLPEGRSGIRQSHDERNLAEFPLVLLTTQSPKDRHTLEYQDIDRHPRTGAIVERKITITGAGKFGLPTGIDEEVLMALIYLTLEDKAEKGFDDPIVYFTRRQLLEILGWPDTGHYYKRLRDSLIRWKGVSIFYENWWDNLAQNYVTDDEAFNILDNFKLSDARRRDSSQLALPLEDGQHQQSLCYVKWNMTPFAGFKNGNLKTLDLDTFFRLPNPAAKRAYRYLNLRLPESGVQDFDLRTFAEQHVGFATTYKPARLRNQVQESIVEPLEKNEFIEPMSPKRRFVKQDGRDRIVFARRASAELSPPETDQAASLPVGTPAATVPPPLLRELTRRHLGGKQAAKFIESYPAAYLLQKIDYFDFTLTIQAITNHGGWLRKAIEEDYGQPPGYQPPEERERQRQAAQAASETLRQQQQADAAERHRQHQEAERKKADRRAIDAYRKGLTPEQLKDHQNKAIAAADAEWRQSFEQAGHREFTRMMLNAQTDLYILQHCLQKRLADA